MEILNDIWQILTIENIKLTTIIITPYVLIEDWLAFLLITSILKINYTKKQKITYILFLSLVSLINIFIIPSPFNLFFNYIIMFIFIKFLFKEKIIKTLLCTIIPTILFALIGSFILKPFLTILNINYQQLESIPIYRILYLLTLYIATVLIIFVLHSKDLKLNLKEDFNATNKKIVIINLILGFFTLCVQLTITVFYTDVLPSYITFLSFISLFAYFFISFYSLTKTLKLQIATQNLQNAENYNNTLSILYDNVKSFKHDFDNMVFTIGGFVDTNDIEGLKKYYKSLEKDCQRVNNISLLNPTLINNPGIYNLLTAKYQKANNSNVEIRLEFFFDLNKLHMPIYEFSRILGILIDNAVEAASSTNEKLVKIMFRDSTKFSTQIVKIENSYNNKNIDKTKIFEKGITEKENHSGMGLWEVKQIVKRNNNINLITNPKSDYFEQTLEIYY